MVATVGTVVVASVVITSTAGIGGAVMGPMIASAGETVATIYLPAALTTSLGAGGGAAAVGFGTAASVGAATAGGTSVAIAAGSGAVATAGSSTAAVTLGAAIAASGPIGWLVVVATGNDTNEKIVTSYDEEEAALKEEPNYSFDCWKPLLHDTSKEPSKGRFLNDILEDPRVKNIEIFHINETRLPYFLIENKWNEKHFVNFMQLCNGKLALHVQSDLFE